MEQPRDPVKISCGVCRRHCDINSFLVDVWADKAYCPLCGEPSPLKDVLKRAGMTSWTGKKSKLTRKQPNDPKRG